MVPRRRSVHTLRARLGAHRLPRPLEYCEDLLRRDLVHTEAARACERHEQRLALELRKQGLLPRLEAQDGLLSIDCRPSRHATLVACL